MNASNFSDLDAFCGSIFWNLTETWYTENPELPECFYKTVLVWLPCVFLWFSSVFIIWSSSNNHSNPLPFSFLSFLKTLLILLLISLSFVELWHAFDTGSRQLTAASFYFTPLLKLLTFILSLILLQADRCRGVGSSGVLFFFWFLLLVCGAVEYRALLRGDHEHESKEDHLLCVLYMIYYPVVILQFVLTFVPESIKTARDKTTNPEGRSTFFSFITFSWFDSMIWRGFRRPLIKSDLWNLREEDQASRLTENFDKCWKKDLENDIRPVTRPIEDYEFPNSDFEYSRLSSSYQQKRVSLLLCLMKLYGPRFLYASLFKVFYDILMFVNPQVLNLLIGFISSEEEAWKGYLYAVLLFVVAGTQTLVLNHYFYTATQIGLRIQSTVTTAVYKKSLKLSNAARREKTVGEIVNLMSVDAQRLRDLMTYLNILWSAPFQICLSVYFLWQKLGVAVLAGLMVLVLAIPINAIVSKKAKGYQDTQMKLKDTRVKIMNEILSGIKVLKLYAWEPSFQENVQKIRNEEISTLKKATILGLMLKFFWSCVPYMVCLFSFATFVLISDKNILDAQTAFVSFTLFNILRFPMSMLPTLISNIILASVSLRRLNEFMNAAEIREDYVSRHPSEYALRIDDGKFSWSPDDDVVLRDISVKVPSGSLYAVVGAVGSGKTSLIHCLLGEMEKISGRVNVEGSIAYVPQQAWIQNATVRNNILMGKKYNSRLYNRVIEACALKPDLEILPAGDKTEIGEKGVNLSGGQKQRVSLARAVYADRDVYILDDPLSAVDSHVGRQLFNEVIGNTGILRNKTRVLVTHGVSFLPKMDHILVMKDGEILESGAYTDLVNNKGAFAEFLMEHLAEKEEENDEEDVSDIKDLKETLACCMGEDIFQSQLTELQKNYRCRCVPMRDRRASEASISDSQVVQQEETEEEKKGQRLVEEEKTEVGRIKLSVVKAYFSLVGWALVLLIFSLNIISTSCNIGSSLWLSYWSETASNYTTTHTMPNSQRDMFLGVYGALGLGQFSIEVIFTGLLLFALLNVAQKLHSKMLTNIMRCPQEFFDTNPTGRILSRFANDVYTLDLILPDQVHAVRKGIFEVLSTLFVIVYTTPVFLAVAIPLFIVYGIVQRIYVSTSRQLRRMEAVSRSPIYSHFSESITGASSIRAYGFQNKFLTESQKKVDQNLVYYYYSVVVANRWLSVRLETFGNIIIFFSALFAVVERSSVFAGLVGLSVSYAMNVTQSLNWLVRMSSEVETNIVAVERMEQFSNEGTEAAWDIPERRPPLAWPVKGQVTFTQYQTRYREGLDLVLKEVNCNIKGGEKVGIVGRTGAGKSSLTLSLFRLIEAAGGQIKIDGIDISTIGLHDLRSKLTIIPQDPLLFSGNMRDNLDPFTKYTDQEIWRCLELAHLKNFVKGLTAGLSHEIAEGGENLSVGQRQLVCLARALLRNTKILVLDEATAAVDLETDALIQETIRAQFKDSTIITIAHRLNTIMDYDRVIVLDRGRIEEFDSPARLLENKLSLFYSMAKDADIV